MLGKTKNLSKLSGARPREASHDRTVDRSILTFPSLDAMREGYEVYLVVNAVACTSIEAHRAGLKRIIQAGGKPVSWAQVICELQSDWIRKETVQRFKQILFDPIEPWNE